MINNIMPKNYFFLLSKCLHFPEKEEKENCSDGHTDYPVIKKFFLENI